MSAMHEEWEAWQKVVQLWGHDEINDPKNDALIKAIQRWGEYLVRLRLGQTPDQREFAFKMHNAS